MAISRRYDLAATTRRVAASFGRRALSVAVAFGGVVAGVTAGLSTSWSWVVASIVLLAASYAVYSAPDWCFEAPDPTFERGSIVVDGMTDKEVMRRFAIATERERFKKEKQEEARKRQERKAKARRGNY